MPTEADLRLLESIRQSFAASRDDTDLTRFASLTCCDAASPAWRNALLADRLRLSPEIWQVFLRRIGWRMLTELRGRLERACTKCESPIEELMFLALAAVGEALHGSTMFDEGDATEQDNRGYSVCSIVPQAVIGKYRVDFKVTVGTYGNEYKPDVWQFFVGSVLVECDGHPFHELTKEQASHDRRKDRVLQGAGFTVFRYTGSDIWRDCIGHAAEVIHQAEKVALSNPPVAVVPRESPAQMYKRIRQVRR